MLSQTGQEKIVLKHLPLAKKLAREHCPAGFDLDDLRQEAMTGLILAARSFDPDETPIETFGLCAGENPLEDLHCDPQGTETQCRCDVVRHTGAGAGLSFRGLGQRALVRNRGSIC